MPSLATISGALYDGVPHLVFILALLFAIPKSVNCNQIENILRSAVFWAVFEELKAVFVERICIV